MNCQLEPRVALGQSCSTQGEVAAAVMSRMAMNDTGSMTLKHFPLANSTS
jgi:hypothetical protein